MKKIQKLAIVLICLMISAALIFFYIRAGNTALIGSNGKVPSSLFLATLLIAIVLAMLYPQDIKNYSVPKKCLIGLATFVILVIVIFGMFMGIALLSK